MTPTRPVEEPIFILALGLGLAGHRPLHAVGQLDVLELDDGDLDAPFLGLDVEDLAVFSLILSVSESVSSRVWRPTTARRVVWAIWSMADDTFSIARTERTASSTR